VSLGVSLSLRDPCESLIKVSFFSLGMTGEAVRRAFYGLRMSAFSLTVHSRPTTSLQLQRNHLSDSLASVKRSGLKAGASALVSLLVTA
jgi:hypothetical protein